MAEKFNFAVVFLALTMIVGCAQSSEDSSAADAVLTSIRDTEDLPQYEEVNGDDLDVTSEYSDAEDGDSEYQHESTAAVPEIEEPMPPGCFGSSSFRTCSDSSGNSYTTQRMGDMSITSGHNSRTGSTWDQTTHRIGDNMSITNGTDADGNSWNATTHKIGDDMYIQNGTDSDGNSFSSTCTSAGCY